MENTLENFGLTDSEGTVRILGDAYSKVSCMFRKVQAGQGLEAKRILEFKSNDDFEVECLVYPNSSLGPKPFLAPFNIKELKVLHPGQFNYLKRKFFLKR